MLYYVETVDRLKIFEDTMSFCLASWIEWTVHIYTLNQKMKEPQCRRYPFVSMDGVCAHLSMKNVYYSISTKKTRDVSTVPIQDIDLILFYLSGKTNNLHM